MPVGRILRIILIVSVLPFLIVPSVLAQEAEQEVSPMAQMGEEGLSLWQLVKYGGWTMVFLGLLSVLAFLVVVYQLLTLRTDKILQPGMVRRVYALLNQGKVEEALEYCKRHTGPVALVLAAGLRRTGKDFRTIVEAMETAGMREAEALRSRNRLLADIGTIAPMLGLLGTVLGLIGAFNVIAFDVSIVKPIMLASNVSKALVTTAAGLVVGIPSMGFFFYFRGALQKHLSAIEVVCLEFAERISSLRSAHEQERPE